MKSLGAPGRALKTEFTEEIVNREQKEATYGDLKDMISGRANRKYIYDGKIGEGFGWAGQVMGLINTIPTVQELFEEMIHSANTGRKRLDEILDATKVEK